MTPRILVGAPDLPHPPFTGGHLRPWSLITALARDHEVVVVGAARPGADLGALEQLCVAVEALPAEPFARGAGARCHLGGVATGAAAADSGARAAAAPEGAQKARAT